MPKISEEPLTKLLIQPFASDVAFLRSMFKNTVGVNLVIRNLIRSYVTHAKAEAAKQIDKGEAPIAISDEVWDKLAEETVGE